MKQSVNLERWSSDDFVSKPLRELPTSVSVGGRVSVFYMHVLTEIALCTTIIAVPYQPKQNK